jgi:hypothetical protein
MNRILKDEILNRIEQPCITGGWHEVSGEVTANAIQQALNKYCNVSIPYLGKPIVLDEPIVLSSNNHLKVDSRQVLLQSSTSNMCLVRNEHIKDGANGPADQNCRDKNISIEGGIWHIRTNQQCYTDREESVKGAIGAIILCGVEQIALKNMVICDSELCGPAGLTDSSYGIQISNCKNFMIENIDFNDNHRDGVHVNGPAAFGCIRRIRGEKMGDDMVALNAWDWNTSAITFGTIEHLVVEDVAGSGNEFRLLPGQKLFDDGTAADCDIRNCVIENLSGIYTFKLYAQPNIANAETGANDVSGSVGKVENVLFQNITFAKATSAGFHGLPVKGLFEVCADCRRLFLEDISVQNTVQQCEELDLRLMNVGPLSAVWKNGSDNPDDWGEVFDPDAVCSVDEIYLKNIRFAGTAITDLNLLTREVHMKVNPDYPKTTPKGGTGYGMIKRVYVE